MREFWENLSIRYKITFIVILTILLVTVTIIPAVAYLIRDSLLSQQQQHLTNVKNLSMRLFDDYRDEIMNYTRLFSNDREIKDTLFYHTELAGGSEHPLRAATRLYKSFDLSSVQVGDSRGRVVAAAESPGLNGEDRSSDPLVRSALKGTPASGIELAGKGFAIKAWSPIYYEKGRLIGVISAGIALDEAFLRKIKELSNTDIALLDVRNRVITTTLRDTEEMQYPALPSDSLFVSGVEHLVITFPLSDNSGKAMGNVLILQRTLLPEILVKAYTTLLLLLLFVLAVSLSVLFILMRKATLPIMRLRTGAERIGSGDFGYRIEVSSGDEIGELSREFNRMAQNLQRLRIVEEKLSRSERLAAIGEFAASVAHEINNPLGNVIGIAKLMQRSGLPGALREDMESIITNANRCARIVKDLLAYSRQSPPSRVKTDLRLLINDAVAAARNHCGEKTIAVQKEIDGNLTDIHVDPLQISQVLHNIMLNAIQAMDSGGAITIRVSAGNGEVQIAVSDTGCGMDDETKGKIFYPFFTTKKGGDGTGLGLAICYGIIKNHGGEITVESRAGSGSRFSIKLPIGAENGQAGENNRHR